MNFDLIFFNGAIRFELWFERILETIIWFELWFGKKIDRSIWFDIWFEIFQNWKIDLKFDLIENLDP